MVLFFDFICLVLAYAIVISALIYLYDGIDGFRELFRRK